MTTPVYIKDIVSEVVSRTSTRILSTIQANEVSALGETNIEGLNFQGGHVLELVETLIQWGKSDDLATLKYPLVYLVQDFGEDRGSIPGIYADVKLNIIIAHQTRHTYKVTDRETYVFKPVLYPIYYALMEEFSKSKWVTMGSEDMVPHRKTDRLYWGRKAAGGNDNIKLTDYLDAIEIENLSLKILFSNC